MAIISKFRKCQDGPERRHLTQVECGHRSFTVDGSTYLQLDTYGSSVRKLHGKVSQSIQLDKEMAKELKQLIERTFPGI